MAPVDDSTLVGQTRENVAGDRIVILDCYGIGGGSRGLLYTVTLPNSKYTSPNGMSHRDVEAQYPIVVGWPQ